MHERIEAYWWSITLWSHTILKGRTIGTKDEQLEQLEYGEDFCCCRSMMHICSLVDKVNSRVQRGSCCRTSVSKEFHKKPAEALLAGEAYYGFKKIKSESSASSLCCWNSWDLHSYLHISCREEEPSFVGRSIIKARIWFCYQHFHLVLELSEWLTRCLCILVQICAKSRKPCCTYDILSLTHIHTQTNKCVNLAVLMTSSLSLSFTNKKKTM